MSVPLLQVCDHLELPPVATYAGVCLWNFRPIFPDESIDSLENLATLTTFTGSLDESWFYLVSVAIEARGAPLIPLLLETVTAARNDDVKSVTLALQAFAERLDELGSLLERMYENCDPHVFYHRIRPFLAGSKNMADAGLPNGVVYDTGMGNEPYRQYGGGSNAQSSLIQFFDIILGITHRPTGTTPSPPSTTLQPRSMHPTSVSSASTPATGTSPRSPPSSSHNNFILDMRAYMPGQHARFLAAVERTANLRPFVLARPSHRALTLAYDAALAMLRALRDKHVRLVSRYIIVKSRESRSSREHERSLSPRAAPPPPTTPATPTTPTTLPRRTKHNIADANAKASAGAGKGMRGTGGTALIPFLKQARDETGEPAVDAWARRLLGDRAGPGPGVRLGKVGEHPDGVVEIFGLAGTWCVDEREGGVCHW